MLCGCGIPCRELVAPSGRSARGPTAIKSLGPARLAPRERAARVCGERNKRALAGAAGMTAAPAFVALGMGHPTRSPSRARTKRRRRPSDSFGRSKPQGLGSGSSFPPAYPLQPSPFRAPHPARPQAAGAGCRRRGGSRRWPRRALGWPRASLGVFSDRGLRNLPHPIGPSNPLQAAAIR